MAGCRGGAGWRKRSGMEEGGGGRGCDGCWRVWDGAVDGGEEGRVGDGRGTGGWGAGWRGEGGRGIEERRGWDDVGRMSDWRMEDGGEGAGRQGRWGGRWREREGGKGGRGRLGRDWGGACGWGGRMSGGRRTEDEG
ncbi:hypothetical protein Tco_0087218 [Tanacetum coccineum]